jgi:hypothetical protein
VSRGQPEFNSHLYVLSFLSTISIMAFEIFILIYFFVSSHYFFSFLSSCFHIREGKERSWFLSVKGLKCTDILQQWRFRIVEWYETYQIRVTGLQDSGWYSLRMQQKQKCATPWTSNDYFLDALAFCNFYLSRECILHLCCRKARGVISLAAYHAYLIIPYHTSVSRRL